MVNAENQVADSKQKIRDKYKGVDKSLIEVIPAKESPVLQNEDRILRVAAYVRVSTENDEQTSSFELQVNEFTEQIQSNSKWEFVGIYSDEGISGTELSHRKGMLEMIEDCKAGKIDLVLTKSIPRFARNIVDCLSIVETLKNLNPPVGIKFETENLYTLDSTGRLILTILSSVAEEESHTKSMIMEWSIEKRFGRGIFLLPELLGYDKDEEGNLVVNPEEAETVKVIYYLYLNGYSFNEIAEILTDYGRKTKKGNTEWSPGSLYGIIQNERHCGDVLARKTFTPNFLTHKSKKNRGERKQYRLKDHHEPIVSRDVFNAANALQASSAYTKSKRPLPVLSVIDDGILKGYVPIDKDWNGFSSEEYTKASESAYGDTHINIEETQPEKGKKLNLSGYRVVRSQFFPSPGNPAMNISRGKLRFNTACLRKFKDVEYVELLLNTVENVIAIRPCSEDNPNAIRWGKLKDERWVVRQVGCKGLAKTLFDMKNWDEEAQYRFRGRYIENGEDRLMLFELEEPEIIKKVVQEIPPVTAEEEPSETVTVLKGTMVVYPEEWENNCGRPVEYLSKVDVLRWQHYAGNWDVLRPARELKEMNSITVGDLEALLDEANEIMEGWREAV